MADLGGKIPSKGGRVRMKLLGAAEDGASYRVTLSSEQRHWEADWWIGVQRNLRGSFSESPPDWLLKFFEALARTLYRQHADSGWPRRVTRWREDPAERAARKS